MARYPIQRLRNQVPKPIDVEFGEQVWAKIPQYRNKRRRSLQERSIAGTWLGIWRKSGENIVAVGPGKVVKVRTIAGRLEAERWSSNIIEHLQATPQQWSREGHVEPTGEALDVEDLDTSEPLVAQEDPVTGSAPGEGVPRVRRPWISMQQRYELGRTPGCTGCEALLITGGPARPHSPECWDRVMKLLGESEDGQARLARAEARMEQYRRIMSESVAPEAHRELPVPADPAWPADGDVPDQDSDDEVDQAEKSREQVERSIEAVYARYISVKPDGKDTKEGIRQVFERLGKEHIAKAEKRRIHERTPKLSSNDVSEIHSPLE